MGDDGAHVEEQVKQARSWLPRACCGGCMVPIVALLVLRFAWPTGCEILATHMWRVEQVPFDAERWEAGTEENVQSDCVRGAMVRDLLVSRKLDDLTRPELRKMLGAPDAVGSHSRKTYVEDMVHPDVAIMRADTWEYYLGFCSGFQIDPDFLVVEFGENGIVEEYYTYQG
ncbi:MAG: hypothetical protein R6V07_14750 [Armatimonadota bacterium]